MKIPQGRVRLFVDPTKPSGDPLCVARLETHTHLSIPALFLAAPCFRHTFVLQQNFSRTNMAQTKDDQQKQAYAATLQRLERIRNHLDKRPRSGRLAGKVAIITGCGSVSGIG